MIELHYWPTPNGWKISIMLEECGLPYRMVPVNIGRGEQFTPEFVALINPHPQMPAIVDQAPLWQGRAVTVTESSAILLYLAEKSGLFLPTDEPQRLPALQWLMWETGGLGPAMAQNSHFLQFADERVPYALERYGNEVQRLYGVLDRQLGATQAYVAGAECSIADFAVLPWIRIHKSQQIDLGPWPQVRRWYDMLLQRPGVQRGLALGRELRAPVLSDEARVALFGAPRRRARAAAHRPG